MNSPALAALLCACALPAWSEPPAPADPVALERLVVQDCGSCHGLTLKGGLGPDIRAQSLQHYDPEGLGQVIRDGIPGTPMPPWGLLLRPEELDWIVTYLLKGDAQ